MASTNTTTSASTTGKAKRVLEKCKFYGQQQHLCSGNKTGAHSNKNCDRPCGCCFDHCLKQRLLSSWSGVKCLHVSRMVCKEVIDPSTYMTNQLGREYLLKSGFSADDISHYISQPHSAQIQPTEQKQILKRGRDSESPQYEA